MPGKVRYRATLGCQEDGHVISPYRAYQLENVAFRQIGNSGATTLRSSASLSHRQAMAEAQNIDRRTLLLHSGLHNNEMSQGRVERIVPIENFGRDAAGVEAISIMDWPSKMLSSSITQKHPQHCRINAT